MDPLTIIVDSLLKAAGAIGTLGTLAIVVLTYRQSIRAATNIQKIETATNSMKDQLVLKTAEASSAEGKAAGRAELHAEQKADAPAVADVVSAALGVAAADERMRSIETLLRQLVERSGPPSSGQPPTPVTVVNADPVPVVETPKP